MIPMLRTFPGQSEVKGHRNLVKSRDVLPRRAILNFDLRPRVVHCCRPMFVVDSENSQSLVYSTKTRYQL